MAAFAALVGSASAAAITWGFGGQVYIAEKGKTPVLSTTYSGNVDWQLALVYVGQNQSSFDIGDLTADSVVDTMDYAVSTATKTANKWNPATTKTTTTAYADGASFAVVLFENAQDSVKFDYVYAFSNGAVGEAVTSATSVSDMSARGTAMLYGAGNSTTAGVVVVPEPGTAALALLGVGMLLKRRRS